MHATQWILDGIFVIQESLGKKLKRLQRGFKENKI